MTSALVSWPKQQRRLKRLLQSLSKTLLKDLLRAYHRMNSCSATLVLSQWQGLF